MISFFLFTFSAVFNSMHCNFFTHTHIKQFVQCEEVEETEAVEEKQ